MIPEINKILRVFFLLQKLEEFMMSKKDDFKLLEKYSKFRK